MALGVDAALVVGGFLVGAVLNTGLAVIGVRFLRVRLATRWAPVIYALIFLPILFIPPSLAVAAIIGTADVVVDPQTLVGVFFVFPLGVGFAIDFFWLPPPTAIEVPEDTQN